MNDRPRNSGNAGKSGQKRRSTPTGDSPPRGKRAYGQRSHGATAKPRKPGKRDGGGRGGDSRAPKRRPSSGREGGSGWVYGLHAVRAALSNPKRTVHDIWISESVVDRIKLPQSGTPVRTVQPHQLDKQFSGAVHQGVAAKLAPLEWPALEMLADGADDNALILVLDQITDPHNVGAMLRLCSAFGVTALVMQTRNAPPLSGALAKVAVGCLETVPVCLETNIANSLINLQRLGWHVVGLAGETDDSVADCLSGGGKRVIVMGAEGPGLRERVRKTCDRLAKIPMMSANVPGQAESLNVATAAGIALYEARRET